MSTATTIATSLTLETATRKCRDGGGCVEFMRLSPEESAWGFRENRIAVSFEYKMARYERAVVLILWGRTLGIRPGGPDAKTPGKH